MIVLLFLIFFVSTTSYAADRPDRMGSLIMEPTLVSSFLTQSRGHIQIEKLEEIKEVKVIRDEGKVYGVYSKSKDINCYVFYNNFNPNNMLEPVEDLKQFRGLVKSDLYQLARQITNSRMFAYQDGEKYVFSGFENGGSLAYLVAAAFYEKMTSDAQGRQKANSIVRVITFHPKPVGNWEFASSMLDVLSPLNMLYFRPYFCFNNFSGGLHVPGVPLHITPFEWLLDNKLNILLKMSQICSAAALLYCVKLNYHKIESLMVNLLDHSTNQSTLTEPLHCQNTINKLNGTLMNSVKLSETINRQLFFMGSTCFGVSCFLLSYLPTNPISESNVEKALSYTREVRATTGTDVDQIGKPSLLNVKRGFIGWLRGVSGEEKKIS